MADLIVPVKKNYWGFSVHHIKSDQFIESQRAVFEEIKKDKKIKKILFTRSKKKDFNIDEAENYLVVKLFSFKGFFYVLRCNILFITHSLSMDFSLRFGKKKFIVLKYNMKKRHVINLWHGIPYKKLYALLNPKVKERLDRVKFRRYERSMYKALIASSDIDSYAMTVMFYPINYSNVWVTGLPRNDFLLKPIEELPEYLRNQINIVKNLKGNKKLILYAPTYRQTAAVSSAEYYQFTTQEIEQIKSLLIKNNAILGIRLHYFRNNENLFNIEKYIDNQYIFDLGHNVATEIAPVVRESDLIISDYSSVFIEAMYLNKPLISFAYDFDDYQNQQEGMIYDFDIAFPGPVVNNIDNLCHQIETQLKQINDPKTERYKIAQKLFYKYIDNNNSNRVVNMIKKITDVS